MVDHYGMDGHPHFSSRDFELSLLHDMYDEARSQTEAALRVLKSDREEAAQAQERRRSFAPWSIGDYAAVLGSPISRQPRDGGGDHVRWPVSVWPELWFEVWDVQVSGLPLMNEGLTRRDEADALTLQTAEDLAPWTFTLQEVDQRFGPSCNVDGFHMSWLLREFEAPDASGQIHSWEGCFVWGLVQRVRKLP